ncbi:hypothetical protein EYC84_007268 [Monilinia fructicola]|uniref:Uncharacterized protein n=1 Tax=Monilinia fructicola TaxID=38448 RepID=A0A5M9KAL6_MONFR|nr:hypothetical protein EYC84_007268 [Monilinia fructicola]
MEFRPMINIHQCNIRTLLQYLLTVRSHSALGGYEASCESCHVVKPSTSHQPRKKVAFSLIVLVLLGDFVFGSVFTSSLLL